MALLTDFGREGHHAGVLHAVILAAHPCARIVDLSHGIPAGDVELAAWTLRWARRWFPPGTVHCAVVDPGVGSARFALAASAGGQFFVGPDNGVLSYALADAGRARLVSLPAPKGAAAPATFHGRDVFAPAAARLSRGEPLAALGPPLDSWVRLRERRPRPLGPGRLEAEVIAADRWGNLATSATAADLARAGIGGTARIAVGRAAVRGILRFYAEVAPGAALALVNSDGHLEIAVNGGSAAERFKAARGTRIRISS